ncbi:Cytochrome P450 [Macleaya cordata]|uniref:Cytochrome P450 n=1 Tax=Macleaya cordata TaxID=56857 RepID=A0A200Q5H6_MACCD|nr:Cytochrome P450 [Macleaya cordata]
MFSTGIFMINMWSIALFFITLAIISFTHYVYRWRNPKCNGKLPPGSMGFPLIGETIEFFIPSKTLDVSSFIKKRIARYGPVFRTNLVGRPVVISTDPEFNAFIMQQEMKLVQLWYMDSFSMILGGITDTAAVAGILKYFRNLILDSMGTESLKEKLLPKLEVMVNQSLLSWSAQSSVELKESIASMVFDWTALHLLNYDPSKSSENLSKMFVNFFHGIMSFPLNVPGTTLHKCLKVRKTAMKLTRDIVHERLTSSEKRHGDLLDQLIDDMKNEEFLTEDLIFSIIFLILLASLETISSALTLAMILLTDHPFVVKELKEEHEAILRRREENIDSPLTWKEYKSMTFTSQVINETLRLANPDPGMLRKVIKDIHINGMLNIND